MVHDFEIIEKEVNGIAVLKVIGELDALVAPKLKDTITKLLDEGTKNIIIDFQELTHINSLAMGILRGKLKSVQGINGNMKIASPNEHILTIFEMVGLDELFEIYSSQEEAIKSFE